MKHRQCQIQFFLLLLFAGTLCVSTELFNLPGFLVILLSANFLTYFFFNLKEVRSRWDPLVILFSGLFLIYFVGLITSADTREAMHIVERKLSILAFPLMIFLGPRITGTQAVYVIAAFVAGCFLSAVYCLAAASAHLILWGDPSFFFYRLFSSLIGMHAIYLSMYYCFAVILCGYLLKNHSHSWLTRLFGIAAMATLLVSIVFLSGRISMLILVVAGFIFSFRFLKKRLNTYMSLFVSALMCVAVFGMTMLPAKNRARLREALEFNQAIAVEPGQASGAAVRPYIWSCCYDLIKQNLFTGVGTGDTQRELTLCYDERGYTFLTRAENMQFNAHNQFIEIAVGLGLPGLLLFLSNIFVPVSVAVKRRNSLYLIFLTIFCVSCLTESMLERQSGIIFYAFFNSFLLYYTLDNSGTSTASGYFHA